MFEDLSDNERAALIAKLRHGATELMQEGSLIAEAQQLRPSALDAYALPRDGADGFFHASTDASVLAIQILTGREMGGWE